MKSIATPLLALTVALQPGCATEHPRGGASGEDAGGAADAPPAPVDRRTTRGDIALSNLDGRIEMTEVALDAGRNELLNARDLIHLYSARLRYRGSYADLARMQELSTWLVERSPVADSYAARAAVSSELHLFDEAVADLERAIAGGRPSTTTDLYDIDVARGVELEQALAYFAERADRLPTFQTRAALANAEAALGRFADADAHYLAAADAYRDVSPLPLAWLAFARGVMWAEMANRPEFALPLYREAVSRLPDYVVANVHLAELEAADDRDGAVARLERVAMLSADPEPAALLAELLRSSDPDASARYGEQARRGYEELLQSFRLAFADHAAEFFMGPIGAEPARALELALENLENRPTPRAYELAIRSAVAAGRDALACSLADDAGPIAGRSANLAASIQALPSCPAE